MATATSYHRWGASDGDSASRILANVVIFELGHVFARVLVLMGILDRMFTGFLRRVWSLDGAIGAPTMARLPPTDPTNQCWGAKARGAKIDCWKLRQP